MSALARIVTVLLGGTVAAAGFDAAGFGRHTRRSSRRAAEGGGTGWAHTADAGGTAMLDDHPERRALLALRLRRAAHLLQQRLQAPLTSLRQTPPLMPLSGGAQRRESHLM